MVCSGWNSAFVPTSPQEEGCGGGRTLDQEAVQLCVVEMMAPLWPVCCLLLPFLTFLPTSELEGIPAPASDRNWGSPLPLLAGLINLEKRILFTFLAAFLLFGWWPKANSSA